MQGILTQLNIPVIGVPKEGETDNRAEILFKSIITIFPRSFKDIK